MTVCLLGANIEDVTGTVGLVTGNGHGRYIRVHVSTNNAEMEGTTAEKTSQHIEGDTYEADLVI